MQFPNAHIKQSVSTYNDDHVLPVFGENKIYAGFRLKPLGITRLKQAATVLAKGIIYFGGEMVKGASKYPLMQQKLEFGL